MLIYKALGWAEYVVGACGLVVIALLVGACSATGTPTPPPATEVIVEPPATPAPVSARLISHPLAGREACSQCHGKSEAQPLPADHSGRDDSTCLACHDVQPSPARAGGGTAADQGKAIWQERPELSCRECHGLQADGGFAPALAHTDLDFATFLQRTRSPLTDRMPPIATAPDDPAFERGGIWITDDDLRLVYSWLSGVEPEPLDAAPDSGEPDSEAPPMEHDLVGREDCMLCHSADGALKVPDTHSGWGNDICLDCHGGQRGE